MASLNELGKKQDSESSSWSNFDVEWIAALLRIRKVPGWYLGQIGYSDLYFSWYSSVSPGKYLASTLDTNIIMVITNKTRTQSRSRPQDIKIKTVQERKHVPLGNNKLKTSVSVEYPSVFSRNTQATTDKSHPIHTHVIIK
jgi:hypothetical protein